MDGGGLRVEGSGLRVEDSGPRVEDCRLHSSEAFSLSGYAAYYGCLPYGRPWGFLNATIEGLVPETVPFIHP